MGDIIFELLNSGRRLLSDGAMGTELQKRGLDPGECPEDYNRSNPDIVQSIYRDYFNAGSDIIETNSFGGSRSRLAMHGYSGDVGLLNRMAAQLATEVRPDGKYVAGSVGPSGETLQPYGATAREELYEVFAEQAAALQEGGVDLIFIETMMALEEATIAVEAAKASTGLPVSASMTFELGPSGPRTSWGVDPQSAAEQLSDAGADILGANCGQGFEEMVTIMQEMRKQTALPLVAYANAGLPVMEDGVSRYTDTPEEIRPYAQQLLENGVNIIGGCCGTGPDHIRVFRELVDGFNT